MHNPDDDHQEEDDPVILVETEGSGGGTSSATDIMPAAATGGGGTESRIPQNALREYEKQKDGTVGMEEDQNSTPSTKVVTVEGLEGRPSEGEGIFSDMKLRRQSCK